MSEAKKHTAIIGDPVSMWSKLTWDADCFSDIQRSYPDEMEPLAYAAINVCIAAASLQDWTLKFLERAAKDRGKAWNESMFYEDVRSAVPEQSACVAIANTAKHSEFRERRWTKGEVVMDYEEGDEDGPPGYVLYHIISGSHSEGFALNRFTALCDNWWKFLFAHGLTDGHSGQPQWRSNKLKRIFGERSWLIAPEPTSSVA